MLKAPHWVLQLPRGPYQEGDLLVWYEDSQVDSESRNLNTMMWWGEVEQEQAYNYKSFEENFSEDSVLRRLL